MRLLHTSDWHIGKRFEETDLIPQQALFCDWIVDFVKQEQIEVVLLAGDIFDRALPKSDAIDLVDDVFNRLSDAGATIVAISGNHDSASALNLGSRFMHDAGLYMRTERQTLTDIGEPITLHGNNKTDSVQILPLPYIDPQRVVLPEGAARQHDVALELVLNHHKNSLTDISKTIVMSHSFVTGGLESDSERPLNVGGSGMVPASFFTDFGYVALGHLHRPQIVGSERIVYSGSPMAYSFSEEHQKSIRVIDVGNDISSTVVNVDAGRPVATLTDSLHNLLTLPSYETHTQSFIRARLTDSSLQLGVVEKLRQRFPYVVAVEQIALTQQGQLSLEEMQKTARLSPEKIVHRYMDETFDEPDDFRTELINGSLLAAMKGDQ
jgi:exonuclease SbcD